MKILSAVALLINDQEVVYIENLTNSYLVPLKIFERLEWGNRRTAKILSKYEISHTIAEVLAL